jgi:hypothetical protein
MSHSLTVIIVEKNGTLKPLTIKDFKEEELFKKCGFKKGDDFEKQHEWNIKITDKKYAISVFAKTEGRANSENKYDFPPPIDSKLFFGNCVIIAKLKSESNNVYTNLTLELWEKMYEKLFGGFEDLVVTAALDDEEVDELDAIPSEKKTKQGYLKDGFVVDSDGCEEDTEYETEDESNLNESTDDETDKAPGEKEEEDILLEDIGSELSEESYDYN